MTKQVLHIPQHATVASTPATPDTGFGKIYIKTDGCWYGLDDVGTEYSLVSINTAVIELGAGVGSSVRIGNCNTASGNYSTVSGGFSNTASDNCSTVSGGYDNTASCNYSTVGGGLSNTSSSNSSTVSGGQQNTASGYWSTIAGGQQNTASSTYSIVGGGQQNAASCYWAAVSGGKCNTASNCYSTVGGGLSNAASDIFSTISGGQNNIASCRYSTVGGGIFNTSSSYYSFIGGGNSNTASNRYSTTSGGCGNTASGYAATIGGGSCNTSSTNNSTIGGGYQNTASSYFSSIGGGYQNTASCNYSTIGGGYLNTASGCFSAILGGYCNTMSCNTSGAFGCNITSVAANTFHVNNLSIYDTPTTAQSNTAVLVRNASTGIVETRTIPITQGLYAQTANSTPITNTIVESSLINGGVGSLLIPANGFQVGDSFRAEFGGVVSVHPGGDTINIRIKAGAIVLCDTGPLSISAIPAPGAAWALNISFTIRAIGAATVASIVTLGNVNFIKTASSTPESFAFNVINQTDFDTTVSNTLGVTAEWGSANALNSIYTDIFILNKIY